MLESQSTVNQLIVQIQELQESLHYLKDCWDIFQDLETASSSGSFHVLCHLVVVVFFWGKPRRDFGPQLITRDLCDMPGNVFVDPCAPDEATALLLGDVYARSQLQLANPYRVQGNLERDFMEQTRWLCFTIPNPRCAGNVPTVNLPSSAEEVYP